MPTVMITGSNRGIGLEFTKRYAAAGWTVIATCRDPFNPGELATIDGDIQVHGLDVTNHPQVDRLAQDLDGTPIDVLINNAGIYGPRSYDAETIDYAAWEEVIRVNTFAPLKVAAAFADHVAASTHKKVVTVTSKMGSVADNTSGGSYIYRSSKAALNSAMKSFAVDISGRDVISIVVHPGWVQTDMGGASAAISVEQSVAGLYDVIANATPADSGRFFNYDGAEIPW